MELFGILAVALVSWALNSVSTMITNNINKQNADEQLANQQQFAHNEAELANQRALKNYWDTESPEARVKQIKDAGLSVGLMYGGNAAGGGVNAGTQAQTPGANLPIMQNPMSGGLNDVFDNILKMSEKENLDTQSEKNKQEIENLKNEIEVNNATIEKIATENNLTNILTENAKFDGTLKQIEIEVNNNTKQNRIEIVAEQLNNLKNQNNLILKEIESVTIDNANKQAMYDAQIKKMTAETTLLYHQIVKTDAETLLTKAMTVLTEEQTQLTFAERQKCYKEIEQYKTINAKIEAETKLLEEHTGKVKLEKVTEVIGWIHQISEIAKNITDIMGKTGSSTAIGFIK